MKTKKKDLEVEVKSVTREGLSIDLFFSKKEMALAVLFSAGNPEEIKSITNQLVEKFGESSTTLERGRLLVYTGIMTEEILQFIGSFVAKPRKE